MKGSGRTAIYRSTQTLCQLQKYLPIEAVPVLIQIWLDAFPQLGLQEEGSALTRYNAGASLILLGSTLGEIAQVYVQEPNL